MTEIPPEAQAVIAQMAKNVEELQKNTSPQVIHFIDTCSQYAPALLLQYTVLQLLQIKGSLEQLGMFEVHDRKKAN